ncbi:adenylate kinase [Kitasatospora viridis]|uniref:Adenylate kinase family enzyme n=1 Tax=Kitasatospora viridis TaxID=281105 RepID=A0A561TT65_9ACTN|nr:adenylate kinase [Kitasatospora viridis]TWF90312.1 adenylate kinase family enzyme [Kitasatospora viridis]
MERVLVTGVSGAGKTTLATRLAARLDLPRYELDALHHGPNWTPRPEFRAEVSAFAATGRWVTEDQYTGLLEQVLIARADTYVWLDLPRRTVMQRVVRRSLHRALTRRELWNGNREGFRDWLDPEHPIRWAWARHATHRERTLRRIAANPQLTVVRLTSPRAVRAWLRGLPG